MQNDSQIRPIRMAAQAQRPALMRSEDPRRRHLLSKGRTRKGALPLSRWIVDGARSPKPAAPGLLRLSGGAGVNIERLRGIGQRGNALRLRGTPKARHARRGTQRLTIAERPTA